MRNGGSSTAGLKSQVREQRSKTCTGQRDAYVVAGIQQRHSDQPADQPGADHPRRVARADERAGHESAENEPEDRQDERNSR